MSKNRIETEKDLLRILVPWLRDQHDYSGRSNLAEIDAHLYHKGLKLEDIVEHIG